MDMAHIRRAGALLLLVLPSACIERNPAEVRAEANTFPVRANWSASVAPVGSATVRATTAIKEYLGYRMEATLTVNGGAPNASYQWRIFRGDCATTAVAANNSPTGLLRFATIESYPDI